MLRRERHKTFLFLGGQAGQNSPMIVRGHDSQVFHQRAPTVIFPCPHFFRQWSILIEIAIRVDI